MVVDAKETFQMMWMENIEQSEGCSTEIGMVDAKIEHREMLLYFNKSELCQ